MNRNELDALEVLEQVNYINKTIKNTGKTTKIICSEIKIAISTLSERFKNEGYSFSRSLKQYIVIDSQAIIKLKPQDTTEQLKVKKDIIAPIAEKVEKIKPIEVITEKNEEIKPIEVITEIEPIEIKKVKMIPTNIILNGDIKKELQVYGIMNGMSMSDVVNMAVKEYLNKH